MMVYLQPEARVTSVYLSQIRPPSGSAIMLTKSGMRNASPKKQEPNGMNFELFAWVIDQAWRSFHRAVEKVNSARLAPLTLAYDVASNLPIVVMAEQVVMIRECDRFELVG